jgi:O-antigen ligase
MLLNSQLLEARATEQAPIYNRIISIATTLRMWVEKPVLGFGFGRYVYAEHSREFLTPVGPIPAEWGAEVFVPHNEFLHTLVMMGAAGLACYAVIVWNALRTAASCRRLDPESGQWLGLALGAALAIYVVDGMFADLIFFEFHGMLFFILFGAASGRLDQHAAALPAPAREETARAPRPAAH